MSSISQVWKPQDSIQDLEFSRNKNKLEIQYNLNKFHDEILS